MMRDCGNCVYAPYCQQRQRCAAGRPTPWHETPEEIAAGLAWGRRKAFLMHWIKRHMGEALSMRQCRVLELYLFRGMTYRQIARATGTCPSSVSKAMKRGVVRLRRLWQAEQARNGPPVKKKKTGKSRRRP